MGRMNYFLDQIKLSRLLAPNLKEMTLKVYTGNKYPGNRVARYVLRDHFLALRWMNPNAVIYLQEYRGQGPATVTYRLWKGPDIEKQFEITNTLSPEEVIAKVLMAARDPDVTDLPVTSTSATATSPPQPSSSTIASTTGAAATTIPSLQQTRSYSTLPMIEKIIQDNPVIDTTSLRKDPSVGRLTKLQ